MSRASSTRRGPRRATTLASVALVALVGVTGGGLTAPASARPVDRAPLCVGGSTSAGAARLDRATDTTGCTDAERLRLDRRLERRVARSRTSRAPAVRTGATLHIPVHVHVIGGRGAKGPSRSKIHRQLRVLDTAYAGGQSSAGAVSRFDFYLASFDRVRNDAWRTAVIGGPDDLEMRRQLHQGGPDALNLYVSRPRSPGSDQVLGWATDPSQARRHTPLDGVVLHQGSLPGGFFRGYNRGDTAVHEVGHWLGLFHTFEGGCAGPGDLVTDTPAQAESSTLCDPAKDSCPEQPGLDAVHNFMDYSVDDCMNMFTAEQVERMHRNWLAYRTP